MAVPTTGYRVSQLKPYLADMRDEDLILVSQKQSSSTAYKSTAISYTEFAKNIAEDISSDILDNLQDMNHVLISKNDYNLLSSVGGIPTKNLTFDNNTLYMISDDFE